MNYLQEIKAYVYLGIHKLTKEFYFGVRWDNIRHKRTISDDFGFFYKTSSKKVKELGFENFDWRIIGVFDTKENAHDFEQLCIYSNRKNPNLINGHVVNPFTRCKRFISPTIQSKESNRKRSLSHLGKKFSKEHRKNLSLSQQGRTGMIGEDHPMFGKKRPEISGNNSPFYDNTIYHFVHKNGEELFCTRHDLYSRFSLDPGALSNVINHTRNHHKGWSLV